MKNYIIYYSQWGTPKTIKNYLVIKELRRIQKERQNTCKFNLSYRNNFLQLENYTKCMISSVSKAWILFT